MKEDLFLVFSWVEDGTPSVEGIFTTEEAARRVAKLKNYTICVAPIKLDVVLPDIDKWTGTYYVYPDKQSEVVSEER